MAGVVLKFEASRLHRRRVEAEPLDIPKTLADLRADLRRIEDAILAVERLAVAQLGEAAVEAIFPTKTRASSAKTKGRVATLSRLPQTSTGPRVSSIARIQKADEPLSSAS